MEKANKQPVDVETTEAEIIEPVTGQGALLIPAKEQDSKLALENTLWLAEHADQLVDAYQTIHRAVLKIAHDGDWVKFGDKGCLSSAGAERIATIFGMGQSNWTSHKETGRDEKGEWFRWTYEVDVSFKGRTVRGQGIFGSRDKFFGYQGGQWKELADIDEQNIRKAARHAAYKEGIRILLGLRNIPVTVLQKAGIKIGDIREVQFKDGKQENNSGNGYSRPLPPDKGTTPATEPQRKMLFALSKNLKLDNDQMHKIFRKLFNKESSKDLTMKEALIAIDTLNKADQKETDIEWDEAGQPLFIPVESEQ